MLIQAMQEFGGIIRDHNRLVVTAYASQTKANGPLEAELLSLMDGVKICIEKHISNYYI